MLYLVPVHVLDRLKLFQIGIFGLFGQLFDFGFEVAFGDVGDIAAGSGQLRQCRPFKAR